MSADRMKPPERHFFVCRNRRSAASGLASCDDGGSAAVVTALRRARDQLGLSARVFITESGCLGVCPESGSTVVVYPEAVWYSHVTEANVREIIERHMVAGEVVERLRAREIG